MTSTTTALWFYTITNLQGSQTSIQEVLNMAKFYTITNLQGSQTQTLEKDLFSSFTPLQTYKVLKLPWVCNVTFQVLHHYKLTRFSNDNRE